MIHLYAVTSEAPQDLEVVGIDGVSVTAVRCGDLHAVVSEHDRVPAATQEHALAHAHVVDAATQRQAAVPVRFGVHHADVATLREAVLEAAPGLRSTLAHVGDAVEFVVRAAVASPGPVPVGVPTDDVPARGRTYLEARLADQRAATEARARTAADLVAATEGLAELARADRTIDGRAGPERCLLVARSTATAFAAAGAALVADRDDLLFGGPWPPYTFVQGVRGEGATR